jgi:hypothetical protein
MSINLPTANSLVINSGPYDNRTLIGNMEVGSRWALKIVYTNSNKSDTSNLDDGFGLNINFGNYVYDTNSNGYIVDNIKRKKVEDGIETEYEVKVELQYEKASNGYAIYKVVANTYNNENDFIKNSKLKIGLSAKDASSVGAYYIKDFEFFKARFDDNNNLISLDS